MNKYFTVVHAVDFRTGLAKVGKCYVENEAAKQYKEKRSKAIARATERRDGRW